ncbi:ABC transporter ATP-binding protein [Desulfogranum japonicum]|uniref:ABC transporter ATP-binding protein n=1 Tax=Desulfogranum japonicum TaxID=231447 RepID=UPI00041E6EB6|nr:ABC transporter ATP-binding protein [Desulfogranum japonicum]
MSAPAVRFQKVGLVLGRQTIFRDLTLDLPAGKCSCLLGPSGCGKSTLLRLISGDPSYAYSGDLIIGTDPHQQHKVAWMSQNDLLLPWMTLQDNVLLGSKLRGEVTEERQALAAELIEKAGLKGCEQALPKQLSGGMRQRGALLRTLMEECSILLMDEPFSALDALTRVKLQNLSAEMIKGTTTVLVTHDPMEALRMGQVVLVLSKAPASVCSILELDGEPPRDPDDVEIHKHYGPLLHQLMQESVL